MAIFTDRIDWNSRNRKRKCVGIEESIQIGRKSRHRLSRFANEKNRHK